MSAARCVARLAVVGASVLVFGACDGATDGASEGGAQPDPLDIVREQVEQAESSPTSSGPAPSASEAATATTITAGAGVEELPPPDESVFLGRNRVVNLWVGPGGVTQVIDVWARRTFTNGPVLLAEGLEFGESSDYFAAPVNHGVVVVGAGAGPDGLELTSMFSAGPGEQITMIFTNHDDAGTIWAPSLFEVDPDGVDAPPPPSRDGNGLVYLYAPNTASFESSLMLAIGASAFYVGNGSDECVRQRIEQDGFAPSILGGTQDVQLDLPAGPATLTLHAWPSAEECDQPSLLDIAVDVVAGSTVLVLVFSRDGARVESLQLPVPLG